ncbi:CD225/dispanin family protein [Gemmatimonadota bacterium]
MKNTDAIPRRLSKAIFATVLFPLFGVVAIFYATKVTPKVAAGDFVEASSLADQAKAWIELTLASAAVVWGTVLILMVL